MLYNFIYIYYVWFIILNLKVLCKWIKELSGKGRDLRREKEDKVG